MVRVSVFYPKVSGSRFDMGYYCDKHIPMVQRLLGAACKRAEVDEGISGGAPGEPPVYHAVAHLFFDSVAAFEAAFGPHAKAILADVPNYTNAQVVLQVNNVKL